MKFLTRIPFVVAAFSGMAFWCCGDDDSFADVYRPDGEYSRSMEDLEEYGCEDSNEGVIVFLSEEEGTFICAKGKWTDYQDWQKKSSSSAKSSSSEESSSSAKSSSSTKSSSSAKSSSSSNKKSSSSSARSLDPVSDLPALPECDSSLNGATVYVESLDRTLKCVANTGWIEKEFNAVPDTTRMGEDIGEDCELEGAEYFSFSAKEHYVCKDSKWVPYAEWALGEFPYVPVESWDGTILEHELSYVIEDRRDSALGKCTASREGEFVVNETLGYSKNGYYQCSEGHWYIVPDAVADTVGLKPLGEGSFAIARFSRDSLWNRPSLPENCIVKGTPEVIYYVYDGGAWRRATYNEMCELHPCLKANEGETYNLFGYTFYCRNGDWEQNDPRSYGPDDVFAAGKVYGTMTDPRDGKVYKTIDLDGKTWMAENLNYFDKSGIMFLESYCFIQEGSECGFGGRNYSWVGAMGIDTVYKNALIPDTLISFPHRGVCPEGWHIPSYTEWENLITEHSVVSLESEVGWLYTWSIYAITEEWNTTGFSAFPTGVGEYDTGVYSGRWGWTSSGKQTTFCSSSPSKDDKTESYNMYMSPTYGGLTKDYRRDGCFVRCLKD